MASTDHTAQFQEPPVDIPPDATNTSQTEHDTSTQFQEPITPHSSTNNSADDTTLHKTTTEKVKDAVKKPFTSSSSSSESSHKLGKRDITSSEMAAANEVLAAKDLKSP